jgi:hypothetical protein
MRGPSNSGPDLRSVRVQCFAGACLLTLAALLPHARIAPIATGMILAGLIQWVWWRSRNNPHDR